MNNGDILQIRHEYTVDGETCLNVFFYEVANLTISGIEPFAFLDELSEYWRTALQALWGSDSTSVAIKVDNLTDGLEFSELATGWSGTSASQVLPSFVAVNVRLSRDSKLTRNGYKRVSGFTEGSLTGNDWIFNSAGIQSITDYCSSAIVLQDFDGNGNDVTLIQRIIGRTKNAQGVYELDLSKVNAISGVIVNTVATTQNSRKA